MQPARPIAAPGARVLKVDVGGSHGVAESDLIKRLQDAGATRALLFREADFSDPADAAIIAVGPSGGLAVETRRAIAIARTAGIHHIVLCVVAPADEAPSAFDDIAAAFAEFAVKLEFASAVAIPIVAGNTGPLLTHLAALHDAPDQPAADKVSQRTEQFAAHIACVSDIELLPGREYALRLAGQELTASVTAVKYRLDVDSLRRVPARSLGAGEIGVCTIATQAPVALTDSTPLADADRFVLSDVLSGATIAAGTVDFALRRGMNVHWQPLTVSKEVRSSLKDQRPCIVWFTGLSGAGKSTIANLVEGWLALNRRHTYMLDGDNLRHGLNKDLGFTAADRVENIRRVGEVARLFVDAGTVVLCSFISPFRAERDAVRSLVGPGEFIEVHVTAPLEVCERRDPKGLYARSRAGLLPNFTGIDSPYEAPESADLVLDTTTAPAAELAHRVVMLLQARGVVAASDTDIRAVRRP